MGIVVVHVVLLGLLHMRLVQRCLLGLGLCPQKNLQATVLVTRRLCVALMWWTPANISVARLSPQMQLRRVGEQSTWAGAPVEDGVPPRRAST